MLRRHLRHGEGQSAQRPGSRGVVEIVVTVATAEISEIAVIVVVPLLDWKAVAAEMKA